MRKTRIFRRLSMVGAWTVAGVLGLAGWAGAGAAQDTDECNCGPDVRAYVWGDEDAQVRILGLDGRPMLGVSLNMGTELDDVGVRVTGVREDGPADMAGIREGDVIVAAGGLDLTQPLEGEGEMRLDRGRSLPGQRLVAVMEEVEEGEEIEIEVTRDGEALVFAVVPEVLEGWGLPGRISIRMRDMADRLRDQYRDIEWDAQWEAPRVDLDEMGDLFRGYGELSREWLPGGAHGLELVELNPGLGAYFGTEEGVLVADAADDSTLGLRAGDVVIDVDGRRVSSAAQFRRILRSYEAGEDIALRIRRDGAETTVMSTIG